jgi:hypothetical protein
MVPLRPGHRVVGQGEGWGGPPRRPREEVSPSVGEWRRPPPWLGGGEARDGDGDEVGVDGGQVGDGDDQNGGLAAGCAESQGEAKELDDLGDADDVEDQDDVGSKVDGARGEGRVLLGEPPEVRLLDGGGRRGLRDEPPKEQLERGGELGVGRVENGQLDELLPQDVHGGGWELVL